MCTFRRHLNPSSSKSTSKLVGYVHSELFPSQNSLLRSVPSHMQPHRIFVKNSVHLSLLSSFYSVRLSGHLGIDSKKSFVYSSDFNHFPTLLIVPRYSAICPFFATLVSIFFQLFFCSYHLSSSPTS